MAREIQVEPRSGYIHGHLVMMQLPIVPKDATGDLREGVQRRRDAAITGRCACGATRALPTRRDRRRSLRTATTLRTGDYVPAAFEHRRSCPAQDDRLGPLVHAWEQAG